MTREKEKTLRPHQTEAIEAIVRGLDIPPGKRIPRNGLRATVVAACGTGKTLMAAHSALRLARHGRVLVMLPTLDLLTQTATEWREAGHTGPAVAVCSLSGDSLLSGLGIRATTSAPQLALRYGSGPVTVYATYASLPVLTAAHEGAYGQRMAPFDLVVVDEAHRTSGSAGKAWAAIHSNEVVPAARRLYMTATPRVWRERPPSWEVREGVRDPLPEELACSMDDEAVFGPVVYRLSLASAVSMGLLARYQIIVAEVTDPEVTPSRLASEEGREEQVRGERLAALHAAVLRTKVQHGLKTMITFHHRTVEAEAFAEGLPAVAQRLHRADPGRYPARVWSGWLCGDHEADERRRTIGEFGGRDGYAVLSNCKVLGEGVDAPAVDSVAFLDPKGSPVDIVQAIGRALRQKPGQGKVASLVVPVFLEDGEEPEDMFTSASYRPLIKVLEGLRAHDEEAIELLAIPQTNTPLAAPSPVIGAAPDDEKEGGEEARFLLRFASPRDPVLIAQWVNFNVIDVERQDWARGWAAAHRYQLRHGDLAVPYEHVEGAYPLGRWLSEQRQAHRAGDLPARRVERLEGLGIAWDPADVVWQENLAAARAYYAQTGTLAAPRGAVALQKPVGQWLTNLRRPGGLGKDPQRAAQRAAELAAIDPDWAPAWPVDWQRHHAGLRTLIEAGGTVADILPGVTYHGDDIGQWLVRQQREWGRLSEAQRERLDLLGVKPLPKAAGRPQKSAGTVPGKTGTSRPSAAFTRGLTALQQYVAREGTTTVSRQHVETVDGTETRLGVWLSNTRNRRDRLSTAQLSELAELGIPWA